MKTSLVYLLKEGLIDIRLFPKDIITGARRIQVRLNATPGVHIEDSNLGKLLISEYSGEIMMLDSATCEMFGVEEETVLNLDIPHALQALQN